MRRRSLGAVIAIAVAVAVALQWLPPPRASRQVRAATPTEVTLSLRSEGPAIHVEHGNFAVTFQF